MQFFRRKKPQPQGPQKPQQSQTPQKPAPPPVRDTWFGDMPLDKWPADDAPASAEPWRSFVAARDQLKAGDTAAATATYQAILVMPNLESRHYLQAWHFLRGIGVQPGETEAKTLYGVIVEVPFGASRDILAAYSDHTARYFTMLGDLIIWDTPQPDISALIDDLLKAGESVVRQIGPWEGDPLPPPGRGELRLNFLTPGGLHFGAGDMALAEDSMAKPVMEATERLMEALYLKVKPHQR